MPAPNFLIIGAARCGSTYLARNIAAHPDVYLPIQKEIHYFDRDYEKGWDYYLSHFEEARPGHKAIGEATPTYMCSKKRCDRIYRNLPDAKLIAILRDPVDRAYSHYWNLVAEDPETAKMTYQRKRSVHPFEEKLESHSRPIEDGLYAKNLAPFIDHFGREQLHVVIYEEITANPHPHLEQLFRFLEVDGTFRSPLVGRRINSSSQKHGRSSFLLRLYNLTTAYISIPFIARWIERANEVPYPPMEARTKKQLQQQFAAPNRDLEAMIGRKIECWNY